MLRKRGKRPPKEKGEPRNHKQLGQHNARDIRTIKGIYASWLKAPRYVLRLDANTNVRMYVGKGNKLVSKQRDAIHFVLGFDREEVKKNFWEKELRVKLLVERVGDILEQRDI